MARCYTKVAARALWGESAGLCPPASPLDGVEPAREEALGRIARHARLEHALGAPLRGDRIGRGPDADREAGEVGGAERGRFRHLWTDDGKTHEVCLGLHQKIVDRGASIDAQLADCNA